MNTIFARIEVSALHYTFDTIRLTTTPQVAAIASAISYQYKENQSNSSEPMSY